MKDLSDRIVRFFGKQGCVIISTVDDNGYPHNSCKGIVKIKKEGIIYLLDLYTNRTYKNLQNNTNISITAVDEHSFKGYSLKGKARIAKKEEMTEAIKQAWSTKINSRITKRLMKNVQGSKGHKKYPELMLPEPKHLVVVEIEEIVDLTPHELK
jgi:predicted pyridoxine 5'-phosphate oxidase superfamily flavin-nucleotide-binding protein